MKVIITKNYDELSKKAAMLVKEQIDKKHDSVLGLATGSTPIGMYKELIKIYKQGLIDFSNIVTFNLDEYVGLDENHPQSYHRFMFENFFNYINIKRENIHIPNGISDDFTKECEMYDKEIEEIGEIDLQVLGLGVNGHIGFNEPDDYINTKTHIVSLKDETINSNKRFFKSIDDVPRKAITMGLGTIMKAKKIILLASGKNKAQAIKETLKGYLTTDVPSTVLTMHSNVYVIIDNDAASLLDKQDYLNNEIIE